MQAAAPTAHFNTEESGDPGFWRREPDETHRITVFRAVLNTPSDSLLPPGVSLHPSHTRVPPGRLVRRWAGDPALVDDL